MHYREMRSRRICGSHPGCGNLILPPACRTSRVVHSLRGFITTSGGNRAQRDLVNSEPTQAQQKEAYEVADQFHPLH